MICNHCGHHNSEDALYCNQCGKKLGKKKKMKSPIFYVFSVFVVFLVICGITFALLTAAKNGSLQTFLTTVLNKDAQPSSPTETTEPTPPKPTVETPPVKAAPSVSFGYGNTEAYKDNILYFLDDHQHFFSADEDGSHVKMLSPERIRSFFIANDGIFIQNAEGLGVLKDSITTPLIADPNIERFYVNEDFIFYMVGRTLYRTNHSGGTPIEIKNDIAHFYIEENEKKIYYSTVVPKEMVDKKNQYNKYISLDNSDSDAYFTLFSCDLVGAAIVKIVETPLTDDNTIIQNIQAKDNQLFFILQKGTSKELYIVKLDDLTYQVLGDVNHYYLYEDDIFYTTAYKDQPYLYQLVRYNPFVAEKTPLLDLVDYNSIKITQDMIYMIVDGYMILTYDLKTNTEKAFFDSSTYTEIPLGSFISVDENTIFLKNLLIRTTDLQLVYLNRATSATDTFRLSAFPNYPVITDATNAYFSTLTQPKFMGSNFLFSLVDIHGNGTPELLVGQRSLALNANETYSLVSNNHLFGFDQGVKEIGLPELFQKELTLRQTAQGQLYGFVTEGDSRMIQSFTLEGQQLKAIPLLRSEQKDGVESFYQYVEGQEIAITDEIFRKALIDIEKQLQDVPVFPCNLSDLVRGLFFQE